MRRRNYVIAAKAALLAVIWLAGSSVGATAEQGTTTGMAAYTAVGDAKQYEPGVTVWNGKFVGISMTEAGKGPLHNAKWECTGEQIIQDDVSHIADGFCQVTDADSDAINLMWMRTDTPADLETPETKGTYLSGTGKYAGIEGFYTFACTQGGLLCTITSGEYSIP